MTTGKIKALAIWTFVDKVMSVLFNTLSSLVLAIIPRSKCLLISWLQSPSAVILEPRKIKSGAQITSNAGKDMEQPELSFIVDGNVQWYNQCGT